MKKTFRNDNLQWCLTVDCRTQSSEHIYYHVPVCCDCHRKLVSNYFHHSDVNDALFSPHIFAGTKPRKGIHVNHEDFNLFQIKIYFKVL